jgi:DsbC/DsbD-like thiol-disulfide interchange protein
VPDQKVELSQKDNNRWGTGEVTLKSVEIFDNEAKKSSSHIIQQGHDMTIKIDLKNEASLEKDIMVGLAIHDTFGVNISGPNSRSNIMKSNKSVNFHIPKVSLVPGEYRLTVAIFDKHAEQEYDHVDEAAKFTIVSDDTQQYGKINLFGKWGQE